MKADLMMQNLPSQLSSALLSQNNGADRRRVLAPRTSEEEALFIARKYLENKTILEAKLANAVNGGRFLRQNMLDVVANELSVKFNVANRNRKYVEQKLRDMKKEARKYLNMAKGIKVENGEVIKTIPRNPPEPIRVMMEAMAEDHLSFNGTESANWAELEFSDTTSKHEGSENEDEENAKSPGGANAESVASTSSSSSIDLGSIRNPVLDSIQNPVLGIDTILGAYFGQPMLAAMASFNSIAMARAVHNSSEAKKKTSAQKPSTSTSKTKATNGKVTKKPTDSGKSSGTPKSMKSKKTVPDTKKSAPSATKKTAMASNKVTASGTKMTTMRKSAPVAKAAADSSKSGKPIAKKTTKAPTTPEPSKSASRQLRRTTKKTVEDSKKSPALKTAPSKKSVPKRGTMKPERNTAMPLRTRSKK